MAMLTLAFLSALVVTLVLTPVVARAAAARGLVDIPEARKVHGSPIPRVGGIALFAGVAAGVCAMLAAAVWSIGSVGHSDAIRVVWVCAGAAVVFLVGLVDDMRGISAKIKLCGVIVASAMVYGGGARINAVDLGGGMPAVALAGFGCLVTMAWLIGVTVAMNFIDGLDGLAAGIAWIVAGSIAFLAAHNGQVVTAGAAIAILGSLSGFLPYNFNPAKVFMGDCGSMTLGFVLASVSVLAAPSDGKMAIFVPGLALSIPLFDAVLTFVRRGVLQRRSLFSAERGHIHHQLLDKGLSHRRVVLTLYGVSIVLALAGLATITDNAWLLALVISFAAPLLVGFFHMAGAARFSETLEAVQRIRRRRAESRHFRHAAESAQLRYSRAMSPRQWWDATCDAASALGFNMISATIADADGTFRPIVWERGGTSDGQSVARVSLPVANHVLLASERIDIAIEVAGCLELVAYRLGLFSWLLAEPYVGARSAASDRRSHLPTEMGHVSDCALDVPDQPELAGA